MNQTVENGQDPVVQWVTFRLEDETYGINVMQVQEVLRISEIAPVPGAPDYVLGIINLRGNVVTVIDTRKRFGLPPGELVTIRALSLSKPRVRFLAFSWTASPRWSSFAAQTSIWHPRWGMKRVPATYRVLLRRVTYC